MNPSRDLGNSCQGWRCSEASEVNRRRNLIWISIIAHRAECLDKTTVLCPPSLKGFWQVYQPATDELNNLGGRNNRGQWHFDFKSQLGFIYLFIRCVNMQSHLSPFHTMSLLPYSCKLCVFKCRALANHMIPAGFTKHWILDPKSFLLFLGPLIWWMMKLHWGRSPPWISPSVSVRT